MSTIDLYKRLEYPNPEEMAANAWLEVNSPEIMFKNNPLVQEAIQIKSASSEGEMKKEIDVSLAKQIKYDLLPPDGQVQMAEKAGIIIGAESAQSMQLNNPQEQQKVPEPQQIQPMQQ